MADVESRTPLVSVAELPLRGREIELVEQAGQGYVNLRGDAARAAFTEGVQTACGIALPAAANTTSGDTPPRALWLGPDEWLLCFADEGAAREALSALEGALRQQFFAANDLSSALTALRLTGPRAREVLRKGCTLDLHPGAFALGQCAQTNVAKTVAILVAADEAGAVDVIVRRSFADYLARWLLDAAR